MKIKSTIKQLHEIDFTKQFVLTELRADKGTVEQHKTRLSGMFPKDTPEQINMKISNIVVRDNIFNLIMNEVAKSYEINYDQEELKTVIERIKPQFSNHKEEILTEIAKKTIAKALIFEILAKRWDIHVTDDIVKESLTTYYKQTNEPIKEYFDNKEKFEGIRSILTEERVANELLRKFPVKVDLKPVEPPKDELNISGQTPISDKDKNIIKDSDKK